jgi:hypothetical protein
MNKTHLYLSLIILNDVYLIVKLLPLSRYNISLSIYNIGSAVLNAQYEIVTVDEVPCIAIELNNV